MNEQVLKKNFYKINITLMRGSITLRSKPGKGSIFIIKIPTTKTTTVI
jgi:chemotaxis protein histidine kinase CheA